MIWREVTIVRWYAGSITWRLVVVTTWIRAQWFVLRLSNDDQHDRYHLCPHGHGEDGEEGEQVGQWDRGSGGGMDIPGV